jgi:hypothetical protein
MLSFGFPAGSPARLFVGREMNRWIFIENKPRLETFPFRGSSGLGGV